MLAMNLMLKQTSGVDLEVEATRDELADLIVRAFLPGASPG